jgi:hypothetical protein
MAADRDGRAVPPCSPLPDERDPGAHSATGEPSASLSAPPEPSSAEIAALAVAALESVSAAPDPDAGVRAVWALLAGADPGTLLRVAACLADVGARLIPAELAPKRTRRAAVRRALDRVHVEALWSGS